MRRSMSETNGKMTIGLLMEWGMGQREARRLVETYEVRGWLVQDAAQGNARVVTPKLADLLTNRQTRQTPTNLTNPDKPLQTPFLGAGLTGLT